MRTGQKRKRPTANDIISSTTNNNSNNNTSSNNNNRGRQRLQRASKDKVYAERLAASSNDNDFNGLLSNNNNGSGIDDSINESSRVGACASNGNGSKRSTRSSKSIASKSTSNKSSSNNSTSNNTTTRSKRTRSRKGTEKVLSPPPPNWPFTSNSSSGTSSKVSGGKAAKGVDNKGGKKKSTRGNSSSSGGDKLSLPPNWPFTEPTVAKGGAAKGGGAKAGGAKKKSSSSRGSGSKGSTSCESSTGVSTNVVDDDKKKKGQKYKQQPVAPRKQSLQQLRKEEEQDDDVVGKEEIMSTTRSTRSGRSQRKSSAASKSEQKECANDNELVDSDEDNEVEKKKLPVSMKQPTIDKLSPPTSISSTKSSAVVSKKSGGVSSKKNTKPTSIDKLSPPTLQNHTEPVSKAKAVPKTTKSSATIDKLSPPTLQSNTKPAPAKAKTASRPAASSKTTTDWSCNRCTLLNTNRKKKCTACGTPRYLTVGLDGTFALDESRGSSGSTAAVREETKSCEASSNCAAAANAAEDDEGDQSEESQQSQLSAMIDAPVFTRSRRREHLSLTQSSSPTKPVNAKEDEVKVEAKEGDNTRNDEDNDQPEENDESQSSSNHIPPQLEQQQEKQQNEDSEQQPSEFKQWIQKRHEKKREKKAKKRQRRKSLVPVKVVTVRPFVNGEHILLDSNDVSMNVDGEQSQSSQQQQQILEAVVEISVLCRIEERSNVLSTDGGAASEDKVRGEQSTPQGSDSNEKPLKVAEKSACQERPMEDDSMEQKLPQGSASEESEEESSTAETTRPTDDDLIAKLAASTLLNMQGVSAEIPSSELQVPPQQDQACATSPCLKESVDDSTLAAKSEADKPSSEENPEKVVQQQPKEVTDHHNTVNKPIDKDDCAEEVADVCRHDDTAKLPADTLNGGNNNIFNYDETSQVPNHDECNNKLNEQECSTSSVSDGRQKEETLPPNEASHKKDEDKSQQNQGQVAYHEEAKRDLAISTTYPSNSQGVASIHSPFIQMTQQLPDFDYMSQVCYYVLFITQITLNLFHDRLNLIIFFVSGFIWYPNELYGQDSPASGRKKIYGGGCASKFKCQDFVIRSTKRATSRGKGWTSRRRGSQDY